jgi:hypothetical protein
MGKDFWTEYRYTAPDGCVTHIAERDFIVHGPSGGKASIVGGYETHDVVSLQELDEIKANLMLYIRPWYACGDVWEIEITKEETKQ